jgi:hypothetical protein
MSKSVQRDDQWSSLPDMVHFRYDDQHPSLPAEGLNKLTGKNYVMHPAHTPVPLSLKPGHQILY